MQILAILLFALFTVVAPIYAADIKATVSEVSDQRSTGQFFNTLEIKLKLVGDDAASIRGTRTTISKSIDDTGRNLLSAEESNSRFEAVPEGSAQQLEVKLKLKNPARKATVVKELVGELQCFMPNQDPAATVFIRDFMKTPGKPIVVPALTKAGINITVLTKKEYESLKKEEEKKAKDAARKQGLTQEMMTAFEGLFGAFFRVGENDLIFKVSDPSNNLVELDVVDASRKKINSYGTMTSHELMIINYNVPIPANAQLRMFLKTKQSVVSLPLRLVDIALP